jgi:hypothetical protein
MRQIRIWVLIAAVLLSASAAGMAGEWTLESARRQWPRLANSVENVGVPGCQWQVGVFGNGGLLFGQTLLRGYNHPRLAEELKLTGAGNNMLHVSAGFGDSMRLIDRLGSNSPAIRKGLQEGRLPMPYIETWDGDLVWHETVFAHLLDRKMEEGMNPRPDDAMVVQVKFSVRNAGSARRTGHLWLHFGDTSQTFQASHQFAPSPDPAIAPVPELAPAIAHTFEAPLGMLEGKVRYVIPAPAQGKVRWHDEIAPPQGMKNPARRVVEWEIPLAAGQQAELRLVIPYGLVSRDAASRAAALDFDKTREDVARFWRSIVNSPCRIQTPDPFVNDYTAAMAGQLAEQVAYRHKAKLWMLKTSPNWYEDYYLCCGARALPSLDLRGMKRYTRPVLQSIIDFQSDDASGLMVDRVAKTPGIKGSEGFPRHPGFLGNFGPPISAVPLGDPRQGWSANTSLMNHGLALWALAAHYRITRDKEWLEGGPKPPLQAMLDACGWITFQRKRTMREENGKKVPHWGLLPAASAHDWLSGSVIFNDAWCILGMAETARLLREIDHPRAKELAKELQDYRTCLKDRYDEARDRARRVPLDDGTTIPFMPRMVTELDWAGIDWTYGPYGPPRAGGVGALDPHDPLIDQTIAFMEAGRPTATKGERQYLWPHYVDDETTWPLSDVFLNRDDLPRYFELVFNNLAAAVDEDFRVGCEARGGVVAVSPADAEHWRMVRDMFVREEGGYDGSAQGLFLLQAIPRCWLRPADRLAIARMGTFFGGKIDLDVRVAENGNSIAVDARLDHLAVKPRAIRMRLRSGDGRPLVSATVNDAPAPVQPGDVIALPATTQGAFHVIGRY